jgi:hypothetical protein
VTRRASSSLRQVSSPGQSCAGLLSVLAHLLSVDVIVSPPAPFLSAARGGREVAVMVATFDPPLDVRQVRTTRPARIEPRDLERVRRLYRRYVDAWTPKWERQATAASYHLWSMSPARGMAVAYPNLDDGPTFRWSDPHGLLGLRS